MEFILQGVLLGLSAGFSPGPLLTLVVSETLAHGTKAGLKVALAPIFTDLPIVIVSFFILDKLAAMDTILGIISFSGAVLLFFMGLKSFKTVSVQLDREQVNANSLGKGIMVNLLSPHPYLFWVSLGAPLTIKALDYSIPAGFGFILFFYFFLVGSKLFLAMIVGRYSDFLTGCLYQYILKLLGCLLIVFALLLFVEGMTLVGLMPGI